MAGRVHHFSALQLGIEITLVALDLAQLTLGFGIINRRRLQLFMLLRQLAYAQAQQLHAVRRDIVGVGGHRPFRQFTGGQVVITFFYKGAAHGGSRRSRGASMVYVRNPGAERLSRRGPGRTGHHPRFTADLRLF